MKDIIPAMKQSPILGLTGMGGGVGSNLGAGGADAAKYIEEVFSTYAYRGNETARTLATGIDNTKGALAWVKSRNDSHDNQLVDTVRGANKIISSNNGLAESTTANRITGFETTGFNVGSAGQVNGTAAYNYVGWNFRKNKGFFDIVTYTGTGSNQTISHGLGSIPGSIMIKCTSASSDWVVYHKSLGNTKSLRLDNADGVATGSTRWNDTSPTATQFTIGTYSHLNTAGETYVAYIFAGADSTAAGARSIDFDGSGDYLSLAGSTDLNLTDEFTIEAWINVHVNNWQGTRQTLLANSIGWTTNHAAVSLMNSGNNDENNCITLWDGAPSRIATSYPVTFKPQDGWTHVAITRDSASNIRIFKNGIQAGATVNSATTFQFGNTTTWIAGITMSTGSAPEVFNGEISNLRVLKGTALYTSPFSPPTEPLTNITNTKLLCCNQTTTTGATVSPGTITANGDPVAQAVNPFIDPDASKYGEDEDQHIINCGSWIGNGSSDGPEIYLGWQPQWLLVKNTNLASEQWWIWDSIRGISANYSDWSLRASTNSGESTWDLLDLTPKGIKIKSSDDKVNNNGGLYVFYAIRRPDPWVTKAPEAGTDVFAMGAQGNASIYVPNYNAGFPIDFAIAKQEAANDVWNTTARLINGQYVYTNSTGAASQAGWAAFDDNTGWGTGFGSVYQSWMWKRHAGFDVVTYVGNQGIGGAQEQQIQHNLSKTPEMIWVKCLGSNGEEWIVGHKDLNAGTNPWNYYMFLHDTNSEATQSAAWNDTAPTSTYFQVGGWNATNKGNNSMMAMLFASVEGICKVGSYTGTGSTPQTISTAVGSHAGFQPRWILIKKTTGNAHWYMYDTVRGWADGVTDLALNLNLTNAQSSEEIGYPTSTGFYLDTSDGAINASSERYIYYAHA